METMNVTPSEVIDLYNTARRRGFVGGVFVSISLYAIYKVVKSGEVLPK